MSRLARLTLLAYPRSFRHGFGSDYLQAVTDLHTHGHHHRLQIAGRLLGDALTTAPTMRWENLMNSTKLTLTVVAAVAALGLFFVAPFVAVPLLAIIAVLVISARRHDQPVVAQAAAWGRHWYLWLAVAAGLFLLGLGIVAADADGDLSTPAWAVWILSWLAAVIAAAVGFGLGATRLLNQRRA